MRIKNSRYKESDFNSFKDEIYESIRKLDFDCIFILINTEIGGAYIPISNFPTQFTNEYLSQKMYLTDTREKQPVISYPPIVQNWPACSEKTCALRQLSRKHGLRSCIATPVLYNSISAVIHLMPREENQYFEDMCLSKQMEITGLCHSLFYNLIHNYSEHIFLFPKLTPKESECLSIISKGFSNIETSNLMGVSKDRIKELVSNLIRKFNASNRTEAVLIAARNNML